MRTVIYDAEDMEPITVVDIPDHFLSEIERGRRPKEVLLPFRPKMRASDYNLDAPAGPVEMPHAAVVRLEPLHKGGGHMIWLVTALDHETTLLLRSVFLPGQRDEGDRREAEAFVRRAFAGLA